LKSLNCGLCRTDKVKSKAPQPNRPAKNLEPAAGRSALPSSVRSSHTNVANVELPAVTSTARVSTPPSASSTSSHAHHNPYPASTPESSSIMHEETASSSPSLPSSVHLHDVAPHVPADPVTPVTSTSTNPSRPSMSGSSSHALHDTLPAPLTGSSPVMHKEDLQQSQHSLSLSKPSSVSDSASTVYAPGEEIIVGGEIEQITSKVTISDPSKSSSPKHHSDGSIKDENRDASGNLSPKAPVETGKKPDDSHGTSEEPTAQIVPLNEKRNPNSPGPSKIPRRQIFAEAKEAKAKQAKLNEKSSPKSPEPSKIPRRQIFAEAKEAKAKKAMVATK